MLPGLICAFFGTSKLADGMGVLRALTRGRVLEALTEDEVLEALTEDEVLKALTEDEVLEALTDGRVLEASPPFFAAFAAFTAAR